MDSNATPILCDGCGLPAPSEHIAERMHRLELATRFRPTHIQTLFVALEPMPRPEDDFHGPPESRDFFDSLLSALDISRKVQVVPGEPAVESDGAAKLLEFQRRGYYLTFLSECPVTPRLSAGSGAHENVARECIARLAPTLVKRIRFNYKPKHVALLGSNLSPLIEVFERAGLGSLLLLDRGAPLMIPGAGSIFALNVYPEPLAKGFK